MNVSYVLEGNETNCIFFSLAFLFNVIVSMYICNVRQGSVLEKQKQLIQKTVDTLGKMQEEWINEYIPTEEDEKEYTDDCNYENGDTEEERLSEVNNLEAEVVLNDFAPIEPTFDKVHLSHLHEDEN